MSKIETGKNSPTIEDLIIIAKQLGVSLNYLLRRTLQPEDYELAVTKSFIERFVRITTLNEYFNESDSMVLNPDEFVYSALKDAEHSLILQMDEVLLDFFEAIAEVENSKQKLKKYESRIPPAHGRRTTFGAVRN